MRENPLLSLNISYWLLQTLAMSLTALLIPRLKITSVFGALAAVVALGFINSKIWDAALFFHIPDSFTLQALLLFLTNGIIFWIVVKLLPGIEVEGILPALAAPVVFTICSIIIATYAPLINWKEIFEAVAAFVHDLKNYFNQTIPAGSNGVP